MSLFIELECRSDTIQLSLAKDASYHGQGLANVAKLGIWTGTLWPVSAADLFSEIALAERLVLLMSGLQSPSKHASCCKNDQTADKDCCCKNSATLSVGWHWFWISCFVNAASVSCNKTIIIQFKKCHSSKSSMTGNCAACFRVQVQIQ